jgi:hypothetical protein
VGECAGRARRVTTPDQGWGDTLIDALFERSEKVAGACDTLNERSFTLCPGPKLALRLGAARQRNLPLQRAGQHYAWIPVLVSGPVYAGCGRSARVH